jgi:putative signal transducing protein
MSLVHLTLAANETEAEIICSLLRSEHIACRLQQNLSPTAYGGAGPIEILVARADLTRALDLIGNGGG